MRLRGVGNGPTRWMGNSGSPSRKTQDGDWNWICRKQGWGGPPPSLDLFCPPRVLVAETTSQQERLQAIAVSFSWSRGWCVQWGEAGRTWGLGGSPHQAEPQHGVGNLSACWHFPTK